MVLFGGLEIVAAGYLIHKHKQNKRERARLEEEAAALEESQYPLQEAHRPHRRHSHSHSHSNSHSHSHSYSDDEEERRQRRRRRRSRERREQEKHEERPPRQNSAPPRPLQTQSVVEPGIVTGWPAHWKQSQTPPVAPPPPPQVQNQYPQDVKYGFVPEVPHEAYQPPPYSAAYPPQNMRGEGSRRDRTDNLEVRGRHGRRSVSPRLGDYEEYSRSPTPRVRFSTEDIVLGEGPPKYKP